MYLYRYDHPYLYNILNLNILFIFTGQVAQEVYQNKDGLRIDDGRYTAFKAELRSFIPQARMFDDPIRTFAYGTDASFYRLNPKVVIKITSEEEIVKVLPIAVKHQVPVTFRSAGKQRAVVYIRVGGGPILSCLVY